MTGTESRRQAIVEAMIRVVGRKGYRAASVADVIAEVRTSRTTFYKHFSDKHDCFLAACDIAAERVLTAVATGCDGERPWLERLRSGLESLVELLARDPGLARLAVVEAAVAGAEARRRQLAAIGRCARLLETGGERPGVDLPANTGLMAASAVVGLLFDEVQGGRADNLPQRLPELLFALLVPYLGPAEAAEEMRRPLAYPATPSR